MSLKTDFRLQQRLTELEASNRRLLQKNAELKASKEELVRAVYQAARDAAMTLEIPTTRPPRPDRRHTGSETAIAILSDWQLGKITATYNSKVCEARIARYAEKVARLVDIQRADHPVRDLRVYLLGDLVEGELIFPGQAWKLDASLYEQVLSSGRKILAGFVRHMLGTFERVHVDGVIGNHGALGGKSRRDYHPESNADAMLYETTRLVLKGEQDERESRLTWAANRIPLQRKWYAVDRIGARGYFLFHGDQIKGGFADYPWYSMGKKILRWRSGGVVEPFDYAFSGHFHTPARNLYGRIRHWGSGSTESSNDYAGERVAAQGDPSQWLLFASPERVTAEYEVDLR